MLVLSLKDESKFPLIFEGSGSEYKDGFPYVLAEEWEMKGGHSI